MAEEEECSICLEPAGPGGDNRCVLPCGHSFHATCLLRAFRTTPCCPLCRSEPLPPPPPSGPVLVLRGELMDEQVVGELYRFRREWRNYGARANRAIRAHPRLSAARDEVRRLVRDERAQSTRLASGWKSVENTAWNSPEVKALRTAASQARRRLRAAQRKLDALVCAQVGRAPELQIGDPDESLQNAVRRLLQDA